MGDLEYVNFVNRTITEQYWWAISRRLPFMNIIFYISLEIFLAFIADKKLKAGSCDLKTQDIKTLIVVTPIFYV
jgi:hypothetical protein